MKILIDTEELQSSICSLMSWPLNNFEIRSLINLKRKKLWRDEIHWSTWRTQTLFWVWRLEQSSIPGKMPRESLAFKWMIQSIQRLSKAISWMTLRGERQVFIKELILLCKRRFLIIIWLVSTQVRCIIRLRQTSMPIQWVQIRRLARRMGCRRVRISMTSKFTIWPDKDYKTRRSWTQSCSSQVAVKLSLSQLIDLLSSTT